MPARDYVALVLAGIGRESDIGVVQSLLRLAQSAVTSYADPSWAPQGRGALAAYAHDALLAAEPAGDLQLVWARTLGTLAGSDEQVSLVRDLLSGERSLPGLSVDAELRWHLLRRLVVLGLAGDDEIDAELERDATAAGQRHAAAARAGRPTMEAKTAAWQLAVEQADLPNAVQAAIIGGFVQPEQQDLLRAFVDPYFDAVADVWRDRTGEMAQNVVVGLYPALVVDQSVVDRTDAYLAEQPPPPALRRLLLEGRAGVARALKARECDRQAG
jgi:aminopeptidase N